MIFSKLYKIFSKINIIGYIINRVLYKVKIGNYVNFDIRGELLLHNKNIVIRDFSEIVVPEASTLELQKNVFIGKFVEIGANDIFIDKNSSIQNSGIFLGNIKIGKNCLFGPNVYVSSGYHHFRYRPELLIHDQDELMRQTYEADKQCITIEDDVWIGKNVVIINGVTIGKGAVIGANTLINKDVAPYTIVGNTPQKLIGKRLDFAKGMDTLLYGDKEASFPYFYSGVDYSIANIKKNDYATISDSTFTLYLLNHDKYKNIVLELETEEEEMFLYANQKKLVHKGSSKLSFTVGEDNQFMFAILDMKGMIKINKVYLSE